jgi:hypothetical protein
MMCLLLISDNDKNPTQMMDKPLKAHQPTIIVNYVPEYLEKHLWFNLPQVEYLKIPSFPDRVRKGIQGKRIALIVETDGHKAVSLGTTKLDGKDHQKLDRIVRESVLSWRFREHASTKFTTVWRFVQGEIIDYNDKIDELDEILDDDTATLDLPRNVEIVIFPKSKKKHSDSCSNNMPIVEQLKIPNHPLPFFNGIHEVTMKVKTDGQKVASAEVLDFLGEACKNSALENINTWQFKEHAPTEFITHWKYTIETSLTQKPSVITLKLPHEVEIKWFSVTTGDDHILKRKKMRRIK